MTGACPRGTTLLQLLPDIEDFEPVQVDLSERADVPFQVPNTYYDIRVKERIYLGLPTKEGVADLTSSSSDATRPSECEHSWLSLLPRFLLRQANKFVYLLSVNL